MRFMTELHNLLLRYTNFLSLQVNHVAIVNKVQILVNVKADTTLLWTLYHKVRFSFRHSDADYTFQTGSCKLVLYLEPKAKLESAEFSFDK